MVTPASVPTRTQYPVSSWIRHITHDRVHGWLRVWVVAQAGHAAHEVLLTDTNPELAAWCTCPGFLYRKECRHIHIAELASHHERVYQALGDEAAAAALEEACAAAAGQGVHNPRETAIRVVAKRIGYPAAPRPPRRE